ncbi:hypothetical protein I552_0586 [Mycobacterium xenopi 3993]|nr:hypothetical protein I552_0586 [Mycobacterium xenopi 3993]
MSRKPATVSSTTTSKILNTARGIPAQCRRTSAAPAQLR